MTKTERPGWVVFPVHEDAIYWYTPGLDNELVNPGGARRWTTISIITTRRGVSRSGKVVKWNTVDLFEWMLEGLKKRGFADKTIGFDSEFTPSKMKKFAKVLPKAKVVDISSICLSMRIVKTPEEIALTQRAMDYFAKIHAFGRDYILEKERRHRL